ncbi:MAG: hypothetical protein JO112_10115 [Planctomycetes bacterium]|nr:hypothetical protein [Planctomycetota bacterium]
MTDKAQPAHKLRSRRGGLVVTIWKNESDKGSWYSVTPARIYKQGDQWKESNSFDADDLLRLSKLLDQADSWIENAEQAERQAA